MFGLVSNFIETQIVKKGEKTRKKERNEENKRKEIGACIFVKLETRMSIGYYGSCSFYGTCCGPNMRPHISCLLNEKTL